jgi:hypothetical protein
MSFISSYNEKRFRQSSRENKNTYFMFDDVFSKTRDVYEIMWKNMVEPDRPVACWLTKATNTQSGCVILTAFPQQQ